MRWSWYWYYHPIRYSRFMEFIDFLVSIAVLSLALSIRFIVYGEYYMIPAALLAVATGFGLHEYAHRAVARSYGIYATYRAWYLGLLIALIISIATQGHFIFAAPGAVEIYMPWYSPNVAFIVAIAGPLTNLAISILCFVLKNVLSGLAGLYAYYIGLLNAFFSFFNLLPLPPLDGYKAFRFSASRWLPLFIIALVVLLLYMRY